MVKSGQKKNCVSPPIRGRGLKFIRTMLLIIGVQVAPYTGAWIEIPEKRKIFNKAHVAPYTGAWIEISSGMISFYISNDVAPYTGAWIEIFGCCKNSVVKISRPLYGGVD